MNWIDTQINWFENAVKELDEMMFCLVNQKQINQAIRERDAFEEALGRFRLARKNQEAITKLNKLV